MSADHKKIGFEQDLFLISQEVGSGFPVFAPKGFLLRREVENYITAEKEKSGYTFVWSPHVCKVDLYKKSGHWQKYAAMFPPIILDKEEYVLKPMNCPHHFQIYLNKPRSYRELPMRLAENGTVYRHEKSGEVNGLLRVRALTIDDTHTFVRHNQVAAEIEEVLNLVKIVFETFGFSQYRAQISIRDPKNPKAYLGKAKNWDAAEKALVNAVKNHKIDYQVAEGEAAFYGPKIDFMVKDNLGREWQLATCQLDYNQPENFAMTYVNEKGQAEKPAILHIAVLGSIERFLGILIEHYEGAFPTWLAPVQVIILPITDRHLDYARSVESVLKSANIRTEIDDRQETLSAKIRDAQMQKVPYMIIVGDQEEKEGKIALRSRDQGDLGKLPLQNFLEDLRIEIKEKRIAKAVQS